MTTRTPKEYRQPPGPRLNLTLRAMFPTGVTDKVSPRPPIRTPCRLRTPLAHRPLVRQSDDVPTPAVARASRRHGPARRQAKYTPPPMSCQLRDEQIVSIDHEVLQVCNGYSTCTSIRNATPSSCPCRAFQPAAVAAGVVDEPVASLAKSSPARPRLPVPGLVTVLCIAGRRDERTAMDLEPQVLDRRRIRPAVIEYPSKSDFLQLLCIKCPQRRINFKSPQCWLSVHKDGSASNLPNVPQRRINFTSPQCWGRAPARNRLVLRRLPA